jgi:hypothetical protein
MARGSEENFQLIITELAKSLHAYEAKTIKHMAHAEKVDGLFSSYGWNKADFFKEMNTRLGIQTNEMRTKVKVVKKATSKKKTSKKIHVPLNENEKQLIRQDSRMLAIKAYRERLVVGLKDAADACDQWMASQPED